MPHQEHLRHRAAALEGRPLVESLDPLLLHDACEAVGRAVVRPHPRLARGDTLLHGLKRVAARDGDERGCDAAARNGDILGVLAVDHRELHCLVRRQVDGDLRHGLHQVRRDTREEAVHSELAVDRAGGGAPRAGVLVAGLQARLHHVQRVRDGSGDACSDAGRHSLDLELAGLVVVAHFERVREQVAEALVERELHGAVREAMAHRHQVAAPEALQVPHLQRRLLREALAFLRENFLHQRRDVALPAELPQRDDTLERRHDRLRDAAADAARDGVDVPLVVRFGRHPEVYFPQ
mmetsp:Transcript_24648/g.76253  ORF Transcript_24648/g.76253 Transcript_24648/m.76253 type:complete len:294 (-) Transcript_24648:12-893(-)